MKKALPLLALLLTALVILVCVLAKTSAGIDEILSAAVCVQGQGAAVQWA